MVNWGNIIQHIFNLIVLVNNTVLCSNLLLWKTLMMTLYLKSLSNQWKFTIVKNNIFEKTLFWRVSLAHQSLQCNGVFLYKYQCWELIKSWKANLRYDWYESIEWRQQNKSEQYFYKSCKEARKGNHIFENIQPYRLILTKF